MEYVRSFGLVVPKVGSFFCTPTAGNCLVFHRAGSLSDMPLVVIFLVVRRWGVSLTRPVLESVSPFGTWEVCLTRPMMESVCSSGGCWSHLQAPCWSLSGRSPVETSLLHVGVGVFYAPLAGICLVSQLVGSLPHTPRAEICLAVR